MKGRSTSIYDRLSPVYDHRWSLYTDRSIELARAHLFANPGDSLLDVGCGTGRLLDRVVSQEPAVRLFGVDASAGMLDVCWRRLQGRARVVRGTADELPLRSASMDWLVSTSVLHHLQSPEGALDEFHRVLRPGGRLIVVDWAADFLRCACSPHG